MIIKEQAVQLCKEGDELAYWDIAAQESINVPSAAPLADFKVSWEIDAFNAEGPVSAALHAQHMQQMIREFYDCGVFTVTDSQGNQFRVDLNELEPQPEPI